MDRRADRCPHCGAPDAGSPGLFQTSTVLISSGGADLVFRSVDEVPKPLRNKLLKSTNGRYSETLLIANRRGRRQVAKAVYTLPGSGERRLLMSWTGRRPAVAPPRVTAGRRSAILAALLLTAAAAMVAAILLYWR